MIIRRLGLREYREVWLGMQRRSSAPPETAGDELWVVGHPPVYTLGRHADPGHLLAPGPIPVERVERGGQVTYHGPGQAIVYTLVDLRRRGLGVRAFVELLEEAVLAELASYGVGGERHPGAPGVYVAGAKIAALGLRIRNGRASHGVALNVDLDLAPFARINPCGYAGLPVTRLVDLPGARASGHPLAWEQVGWSLACRLAARLAPAPSDSRGPPPRSFRPGAIASRFPDGAIS